LLGTAELKARNLPEAVYWWCQTVHGQEEEILSGRASGADAPVYVYLGCVAEILKAEGSVRFYSRNSSMGLGASSKAELNTLCQRAEASKLREVLRQIAAMLERSDHQKK
jgi:hypothetical protein